MKNIFIILFLALFISCSESDALKRNIESQDCLKVKDLHESYSSASGYTYSMSIGGQIQVVSEETYNFYLLKFYELNGDVCWEGNK